LHLAGRIVIADIKRGMRDETISLLCLVRKIVQLDKADREVLFSRTSEKKGLNPSIFEK
jgi:hypothetical protein